MANLTYLVSHPFLGGPWLPKMEAANFDSEARSAKSDLSAGDLGYISNFLYDELRENTEW